MGMCTACSEESVRAKPTLKRKPPTKAKTAKGMDEGTEGNLFSTSGKIVEKKKPLVIAVSLSEAAKRLKK